MQVDAASLDLGEVWETPDRTVVLPLRNLGKKTASIKEFATSCDCSGVEPKSLKIPPGETAEVRVKLDLTHRLPHHMGMARRSVSVRLDPVLQGNLAPTPGWELKAVVRSRVSLATHFLDFADLCVHGGKPVYRKVRAPVHVPLARLEAAAPPSAAAVRVEPARGEDGQYDIVVFPDPKLPVGPFRFDITVTAVTSGGQRHPCASITVKGDMQPPTRILPAVVLLGEHPVPGKAEAFVAVRLPSAEWVIDHIETDSADTTVAKAESAEAGTLSYRVSQQITRPGDQTSVVRFVLRRPDGKLEPSEVNVH